ncbi:arginine utilization regulatory protein [Salsuginibacillus halophilus]|uniref:Arginine utilization regulatory protein n=1 Tax=Salsuginibacillus halophilus TaxID=517424 RepID=A0A2P8H815_9BACI|nr:sigma 54-interacting transcriptional regulator [Salsuginibacillus halophilus]PSL42330.1 arginine utilization regulatory protein [Salsuginibacillus halophilus]
MFTKEDAPEVLATLVDHLDTGVHMIDAQAQTVYYNEKMAAIEGMSREEVIGSFLHDVFHFEMNDRSTLMRALESGERRKGERQTYYNARREAITTINDTFPVLSGGRIIGAVELARDVTKVEKLIQKNLENQSGPSFTFDSITGSSTKMQEVINDAKRSTRTTSSVLIVGETGTGKELFAQSIHTGSERSRKPLISQNCAAIPEQLLESMLFGTKSGAFTGSKERPGLFEEAHGGTLLLDEINSLSPALQAKLLRAIQEKVIRRVGGTKDISVDVRIIATMNQDPVEAVNEGFLRKDLYYRLSVVSLFVPPLRERLSDIDELVEGFLAKYNALFRMDVTSLSPEVHSFFYQYDWPGNVRELEHVIEGALNFMEDGEKVIQQRHLPPQFQKQASLPPKLAYEPEAVEAVRPLHEVLADQEQALIQRALTETKGNVSEAAERLELRRQSLQYRLQKYGISPQQFRR